jgi:hypothetical protein
MDEANAQPQPAHVPMNQMHWSSAEKAIARRAFNRALQQEFADAIRSTKEMAARLEQPEDLWKLERYLNDRRRAIDEQYDYRYSVLPLVFGRLISEGRLSEADLQGLDPEKLRIIRNYLVLA